MKACFECGQPATQDHHVVPESKGGTQTVPLCDLHHGVVHGRGGMHIAALTKAALARKKAAGQRTGGVTYGYRLAQDNKTLVPDAYEQQVIDAVRYAKGQDMTVRSIVAFLAQQGFKSREGTPFLLNQVQRMIEQIRSGRTQYDLDLRFSQHCAS